MKEWWWNQGQQEHLDRQKCLFLLHTLGYGEKKTYMGDSIIAQVLGKRKFLLKLTSGKILALNDVLQVPNIRANMVSVALVGKIRVKVSLESDKIVIDNEK